MSCCEEESLFPVQYSQVLVRLNNLSGNSIIPIHGAASTPESLGISTFNVLFIKRFVEDIRVKVSIKSSSLVNLPEFELGMSDMAKTVVMRDNEWKSPRKQLDILLRKSDADPWLEIGSLSLLNRGISYTPDMTRLFGTKGTIKLGRTSTLGVRITDVGYGLLSSNDEIVIYGTYVEEIKAFQAHQQIESSTNYGWDVGLTPKLLLAENPERKYVILSNASDRMIWVSFDQPAEVGKGLPLYPRGSSYEWNADPSVLQFTKKIYAIGEEGEGSQLVTGIECV